MSTIRRIFHPSDPVAYRIEPLLLPPEAKETDITQPIHLIVEGEGFCFHVKAQEIGVEIAKMYGQSNRSFSRLNNRAMQALGHSNEMATRDLEDARLTGPQVFPLRGKSDY